VLLLLFILPAWATNESETSKCVSKHVQHQQTIYTDLQTTGAQQFVEIVSREYRIRHPVCNTRQLHVQTVFCSEKSEEQSLPALMVVARLFVRNQHPFAVCINQIAMETKQSQN
jgi:hypothetical protein